ncbi:hypothetical protein [Actinoplanes sp. NPDC051851]|uniref:hypothetical protein n=1 Tax=Actinoplanes sp. NPDC051851 TaxID=3154753 RepID=UPI003416F296
MTVRARRATAGMLVTGFITVLLGFAFSTFSTHVEQHASAAASLTVTVTQNDPWD